MPHILKSVSKRFGDKLLFNDFSCEFNDRGIYFICGESGVGKTTLLRIIAGLDKDYSGSVELSGDGKVSYAFQEYRLFPTLTALDNVVNIAFAEPNDADREKSKSVLFQLGLTEEDLALYPSELSGGMKQRVSLARAFLRTSSVLLLDEPTKEMNEELCQTVRELIRAEGERRTVIMVSHSKNDIAEIGGTEIRLERFIDR